MEAIRNVDSCFSSTRSSGTAHAHNNVVARRNDVVSDLKHANLFEWPEGMSELAQKFIITIYSLLVSQNSSIMEHATRVMLLAVLLHVYIIYIRQVEMTIKEYKIKNY